MAEQQEVKSRRDQHIERLRNKYPDKKFEDDEEIYTQISDDYDSYEQEIEGMKGREQAFSDMFTSDPRSARILMDWKNGQDPAVGLVRLYGTDIADAINDPEKQEAIAEANKEYMERVAKEAEYEEQYQSNLASSLSELERIQTEQGLSDEQIDAAMGWIMTVAKDAMLGKFTPETIQAAIKAQNFDSAVEQASQEGEVRGRNAKITEKLKQSQKGDGTNPLGGRNGMAAPPKKRSIFDEARDAM